jgi:glutathione synthase/RimK-type ligase-like ATP-grasp enzyme
MIKFDITLLTSSKYLKADPGDDFTEIILEEDRILTGALEKKGLRVTRTYWDDPNFNWAGTEYVLFRTPWDYFNRYSEFAPWLEEAGKVTKFLNPIDIINWNIDKHYMLDLEKAGINIPPTVFIEPGDKRSLTEITSNLNWREFILKPAISGGAWHTYRMNKENIAEHEEIFGELIKERSMLVQEYQESISSKGEVSYMVIGGKFTHAVLKKGKGQDFRVQENFGGTVHDYSPTAEEIAFAQLVVKKARSGIIYARVDVMWDNDNKLSLGELEVFEPALWLRKNPTAAEMLADIILEIVKKSN